MSATWADLVAALAAAPDLPEALCRGHHALFDGVDFEAGETRTQAAKRHEIAAAICRRCPEQDPCREYSIKAFPSPLTAVVGGRVPSKKRPSEKSVQKEAS